MGLRKDVTPMEAYVMDAFSRRVFGGNQAGVVLPDRPLDEVEKVFIDRVILIREE